VLYARKDLVRREVAEQQGGQVSERASVVVERRQG